MERMPATRSARALAGLLILSVGAAPALAQGKGPGKDQGKEPAEVKRMRKAWSLLLPEEQADVAAWFSADVAALGSFQGRLLAFAVALEPADPVYLPEDPGIAWFDPKEHAPGDPIPRRKLDEDSTRVTGERKRLFESRAAPLPSVWRYDWGTRTVVRSGDFQAPEHVFELGLAGLPPQSDLAIALLERALDNGEEQVALGAFGHAYTDREGWVFPGITLYDAWCSGQEIEMPDVDNLGLVHVITGKRGRWKAPIPASEHDELYELVGEHFQRVHRFRELRSALARSYLAGSARLDAAYLPHLLRLHGLWEQSESDPAKLSPLLPDSKGSEKFLPAFAKKFDKDGKRVSAAKIRWVQLDEDARQVRALLESILEQSGAFDRKSRPPAKTGGAGPR
jgi:hypothetical protein